MKCQQKVLEMSCYSNLFIVIGYNVIAIIYFVIFTIIFKTFSF